VLDARRNVVLANLVQERTVADAQQLGSSLSIPASLSQSIIDGVNFRFVAMAAQREVNRGLCARDGRDLAADRLPRFGVRCAPVTAVFVLGFGVIHLVLSPQIVSFDRHSPEGTRRVQL